MRPFYFLVHPDLFGRFPEERAVNENSLKLLSVYLEALQKEHSQSSVPSNLPFYIRNSEAETKGSIKFIKIPLIRSNNPKDVLGKILKSCDLSLENIDKIKVSDTTKSSGNTAEYSKWNPESTEGFNESIIFGKIKKVRDEQTLK